MIVNGKDYNIDEFIEHMDFNAHSFKKTAYGLMLTNEEIAILRYNQIDYQTAKSLKDLMIKIQEVFDDETMDSDDLDDLEYVLETISERDYYENTIQ